MRSYRSGMVLLIAVLISAQIVNCDGNKPVTNGSKVEPKPTEQVTASSTDAISYEVKEADTFFDTLKKQLRCGYPKFGIPSLVPLKLSYKFKTSLDFLSLMKVQITASNIVIHGLDNFTWIPSNTSFSRSKTGITLNFPNITTFATTSINRANGTSRLSLYDTLVHLDVEYEEKDDLLYLTNLDGDLALRASTVRVAHLMPKSGKLTKIWNKALGESLPVIVKMITSKKLRVEYINRIINGSKYYAISTANNALASYNLNFDRLVDSFKRFSEVTSDSLMCTENDIAEQSRII
ncbi:uncharacterized protein LOC129770862 [Toxorhynchites rutilus septentrionalis]|uniref:uncharacterized protein LOC129770862 n=1 Tax=Toxorhynchites rutilus septentrionalis TaxID=329112 RepID=UPI002479268E|nr:uncharacterized protein LOC129770862 [Toxorhynchites rutilus septentrionalis]